MNGMETLLSHPAVEGTARVLVHFMWQGAGIAILYAAVRLFLPVHDSSIRFRAAAAAMTLMFLAPLATAIVLYLRVEPETIVSSSKGVSASIPVVLAPLGQGFSGTSGAIHQSSDPWPSALVFFWLAGMIVLSIRNLSAYSQVRRLTRTGVSEPPAEWTETLRRLSRKLGVTTRVRLLSSRLVSVPTVVGWLRPAILIPAGTFTGMHPHHLEAILAHELAHVRRHDYLMNLIETVVETVLFYHPAVWWVSRQVRTERENCCDDIAVRSCGDVLAYARALAEMESWRGRQAPLAMRADGGSLLSRISRLAGRPAPTGGDRWVPAVLVLFSAAGLLFLGFEAARSPSSAMPAEDDDGWNLDSLLEDGEWEAEYNKDHLLIRVAYRDGDWATGMSLEQWGFTAAQVEAVLENDRIDFDYPREAGLFHFTGEVVSRGRKTRAKGSFNFDPSTEYIKKLEDLGYGKNDVADHQMELAGHDVTSGFIRKFLDVGYRDLSLDRLVEFKIHGISPDYAAKMADAGYPGLGPERLVEFKIHGISPDYAAKMADAGYPGLDPERLVEFKIHGISPDYALDLNQAFGRALSPGKTVEMKIHGVSPDLVRDLRDKIQDLTPDEVLEIKIHGLERYLERTR